MESGRPAQGGPGAGTSFPSLIIGSVLFTLPELPSVGPEVSRGSLCLVCRARVQYPLVRLFLGISIDRNWPDRESAAWHGGKDSRIKAHLDLGFVYRGHDVVRLLCSRLRFGSLGNAKTQEKERSDPRAWCVDPPSTRRSYSGAFLDLRNATTWSSSLADNIPPKPGMLYPPLSTRMIICCSVRRSPTVVRSGPRRPPYPDTLWQ